jgi:hypothetical protein
LEAARRLSPRNVPILSALEAIYRKAGRDEQLAGILRARIELSPEDYSAYLDLADVHVRTGQMPEAQKVLDDMEASPSQLPEKYLLLARASARYGLAKRAFLLYRNVIDSGVASMNDRLEFCQFCLAHAGFAGEASAQANALSEATLDPAGFVRLAWQRGSSGRFYAEPGHVRPGASHGRRTSVAGHRQYVAGTVGRQRPALQNGAQR